MSGYLIFVVGAKFVFQIKKKLKKWQFVFKKHIGSNESIYFIVLC